MLHLSTAMPNLAYTADLDGSIWPIPRQSRGLVGAWSRASLSRETGRSTNSRYVFSSF